MKRSEMESILMNSIIRNTYNYGEEHDEKAILRDLEKAGMQPPTYEIEVPAFMGYTETEYRVEWEEE